MLIADATASISSRHLTRDVNLVQNVGDVLCRGSGDRSPPVGSRGEAPVGDLGEVRNFWISICIILT